MAYVRRHWLSSVLYIAVIVLGLAVWLTPTLLSDGGLETAQAQAVEPQAIDPHLYTRVQKLRQELSLTNQDLAAMGCTNDSAALILEGLKTWCATNKAVLDQQHRDELKAKAAMRETIRQINVGTVDARVSNSLPSLQQDLLALLEQHKTVQRGLVAQLEGRMDAYQLKTWQSARANVGLPAQLRYVPDLTYPQRQAIHSRLTDRSKRITRSEAMSDELSWSQKQALDSTRLNATTKAIEVRNAEVAVLPMPEMLRNQTEMITELHTQ